MVTAVQPSPSSSSSWTARASGCTESALVSGVGSAQTEWYISTGTDKTS